VGDPQHAEREDLAPADRCLAPEHGGLQRQELTAGCSTIMTGHRNELQELGKLRIVTEAKTGLALGRMTLNSMR
jgi:hypothetical protein